MTIQLRHLSSLLRAKPAARTCPDVPGLAYYSAPEGLAADAPAVVAACSETPSPELQALDAMYGYYTA